MSRLCVILFCLAGVTQLAMIKLSRAQVHHHSADNVHRADSASLAFVSKARQATAKYLRIEAAIADGYRPIGPDMPNMGQHWINPVLAMQRSYHIAEPAMLTYLNIGDAVMLTGVAYTVPLQRGESPPPLPFPGLTWHFHSEDLSTEASGHSDQDAPGARLAMFHAWIWTENPEGMFVADNWALPFVRLNQEAPNDLTPEAARAVFLLTDGVPFYLSLIDQHDQLSEDHVELIQAILESARSDVQVIIDDLIEASDKTASKLSLVWRRLQEQVLQEVPAGSRDAVRHILQ